MNLVPKKGSAKYLQVSAILMNHEGTVFVYVKWYTTGPLWRPRSIFRQLRSYGIFEVGHQEIEDCDVLPVVYSVITLTPSSDGRNYSGCTISIQIGAECLSEDEQDMSIAYLEDCTMEDVKLFVPSKGLDAPVACYSRRSVPRLPPPKQE